MARSTAGSGGDRCRSWGCGAVALLASSCMATVGTGEVVRQGLRFESGLAPTTGWSRVETTDFTLETDLPPDQVQRAAQILTQSLVGLRSMFGRAPILVRRRLEVYALRDGLEFERRFGRLTWGFTSQVGDTTRICLYGSPDRWFVRTDLVIEGSHSVLVHELAHAVLGQYFPRQPQWFSEGLAQYLDTYQWLDPETVRFGDPNLTAYRNYRAVRSLTVSQLLAWNTIGQRELQVLGMYGLSWAFVHFAFNRMPRELERYMATLAQEGPTRAWALAFAPGAGGLDEAIYAYMKVGEYQFRVLKVPLTSPALATIRATTPAEDLARAATLDALEERMKTHRGE